MLHDKDLVSIQEVRTKIEKAYAAWQKYRTYSQQQVDAIVERMAAAGRAHARRLAELAVEETGYGNVKDKIAKNLLCSDLLARKIRDIKTVGVLRELPQEGLVEIGVPMGVVAAILPTTNPTSTAIFKILISLKAGNAIVISPHPRAVRCTCETADLLYRAALEAGAPPDIIQCTLNATLDGTHALMHHECTAVILATGGAGMVRAAYTSGKTALGVGPGNVPVLIERSADLKDAIAKVVDGKSFDYGTVCSSEQAIVVEGFSRDQVIAELKANRAFIANEAQAQALAKLLVTPKGAIDPKCVGQAPTKIAKMAGFEVPPDTSIIACDVAGVGRQYPLSAEKLSPVLAMYFAGDFNQALDICQDLLEFGGLGHTCVIYSKDDARIRQFGMRMHAMRVLVNTPAPQGSTGITTNVFPSMTLGCGAAAGNSTGDNVGPQHLINIKRIASVVRNAEDAFTVKADDLMAQPAQATQAASLAGIDHQTIVAAVERYLAQRGISLSTSAAAPASSPAQVTSSVVSSIAQEVVDRFLSRRAPPEPARPGTGPG